MKHGTIQSTRCIAFALALIAVLSGYANAQQKTIGTKEAGFSKWGLSFEYPSGWQEHPADRVAMMKDYLAKELRPYGRELQEFAMIVGPNQEIALLITKYVTPKSMKPSEFIKERNKVYDEAKRAGDVTKVNHVKEITVSKLPAVEEDVERSNGGRGRTYKVMDGTTVFEVSIVVHSKAQWSKYSTAIENLVSSMTVTTKTGRPRKEGDQK